MIRGGHVPGGKRSRSPSPNRGGKGGDVEKKAKMTPRPDPSTNQGKVQDQLALNKRSFLNALNPARDRTIAAKPPAVGAGPVEAEKALGAPGSQSKYQEIAKQYQKENKAVEVKSNEKKRDLRQEFADRLTSLEPGDIMVRASAWKHVTRGAEGFDQETYDACVSLNVMVDDLSSRKADLQVWVQNQPSDRFAVTENDNPLLLNFSVPLRAEDSSIHVAGSMHRKRKDFVVKHVGPGAVY